MKRRDEGAHCGAITVGTAIALTLALMPLCGSTVKALPKADTPQAAGKPAAKKLHAASAHPASMPGLRLKLKFKVGDVTRYLTAAQVEAHLPAAADGNPAPVYTVSVSLEEKEKVVQVLPDGTGELEISTLSGTGTLNGKPFAPPASKAPSQVTFGPLGDLLRVKDLAENANVPVLGNLLGTGALSMHGVCLTAHPVRPGDVWTKTIKVAGMTGSGIATVKSSFVREEQVGRYRTARIHSLFSSPIHAWIDANAQPTMKPQAATNTLVGTLNIIFDMNLAIAEGKVVRSAGIGRVSVTIQPLNATPLPASHSKAHMPTPSTAPTQMEITLQLGTDLQE